ncbi:MAG: phosphopentomutase [Balneolaceae bacterium]
MARIFLVVIDGLGIGAQEDAKKYGDENADTLGSVCDISKCRLPNFQALGLGNIRELSSVPPVQKPIAAFGKMRELSAGKDSTTGHWELAGIHMNQPFPTYPEGFPEEIIQAFCNGADVKKVLCNAPYSGTEVIKDYGEEHIKTGFPIVYTSADSVFQVACHTEVVTADTLYRWCEYARQQVLTGLYGVGRVIARPFAGQPGNFHRLSDQRHDFSRTPPQPNLLSLLQGHDVKTYSVGKIIDLFAGQGFLQYRRTKSNAEGISQLLSLMSADISNSFVFANLIDTDQIYGHRQDPVGFGKCLEEIDRSLPAILKKLQKDDSLILTGDHGNDPADNSTDHTREYVPLLVVKGSGTSGSSLGTRNTFSDVSATVLDRFAIENTLPGNSFLQSL